LAVVSIEDGLDEAHVLLEVLHVDGAVDHGIDQALADLRFSAARDRAGLVTERALGGRPDEAPARRRRVLFHPDLVAARMHVDAAGQKLQRLVFTAALPADGLLLEVD